MKKLTLLLCFLIAGIGDLHSQNTGSYFPWYSRLLNPEMSYDLVQQEAEAYYSVMPDSIISKEKKFFNRACWFLQSRVGSADTLQSKNIEIYNRAMAENILGQYICPGNSNNANWQYNGPFLETHQIGIVTAVYADTNTPDIIYAGTNASGLWKTENGGNTWRCLTDTMRVPGMGIQCICPDRNHPDTMLIATGISTYSRAYGLGILRTLNGGQSFEIVQIGNTPYAAVKKIVQCPAPDSANVFYAISGRILFRSEDYGLSWETKITYDLEGDQYLDDLEASYSQSEDAVRLYVSICDPLCRNGGAQLWYLGGSINSNNWQRVEDKFVRVEGNLMMNGDFEEPLGSPRN